MTKDKHTHNYKPKDKQVLLAQYGVEDTGMTYQKTTGKDTLKQLVCTCGEKTTVDLVREKY